MLQYLREICGDQLSYWIHSGSQTRDSISRDAVKLQKRGLIAYFTLPPPARWDY